MTNRDSMSDQNVERMLQRAYDPEVPDADFVQRVKADLMAVAQHRHELARSEQAIVEREAASRSFVRRNWRPVLAGSIAVAVMMAIVYSVMIFSSKPPNTVHQATLPSQPEKISVAAGGTSKDVLAPGVGKSVLTARPRPKSRDEPPLATGASIATSRGERRRVTLPDGSVMFVNENSKVVIQSPRRLKLIAGEVYLEVSPVDAADPADSTDSATFRVTTLDHTVTAVARGLPCVQAMTKHASRFFRARCKWMISASPLSPGRNGLLR